MRGDLTASGPGCVLRLSDHERVTRITVDGRVPRALPGASSLIARLASSGVVVELTDPSGRLLARAGAGVRSPLGRLIVGSWSVAPTLRGIVAGLRRRTAGRAITPRGER